MLCCCLTVSLTPASLQLSDGAGSSGAMSATKRVCAKNDGADAEAVGGHAAAATAAGEYCLVLGLTLFLYLFSLFSASVHHLNL